MNGELERLGHFNLELSKKVAQNCPILNKENFILLFYKNFGGLCNSILKSDRKSAQRELSKLLIILNALHIIVTTENYKYDYRELKYYSRASRDNYHYIEEILEFFIDFCGHFLENEDKKMRSDLGFYKSATFVFTAIFAYAEYFLDGSLALCYEAKKTIEKENVFYDK